MASIKKEDIAGTGITGLLKGLKDKGEKRVISKIEPAVDKLQKEGKFREAAKLFSESLTKYRRNLDDKFQQNFRRMDTTEVYEAVQKVLKKILRSNEVPNVEVTGKSQGYKISAYKMKSGVLRVDVKMTRQSKDAKNPKKTMERR